MIHTGKLFNFQLIYWCQILFLLNGLYLFFESTICPVSVLHNLCLTPEFPVARYFYSHLRMLRHLGPTATLFHYHITELFLHLKIFSRNSLQLSDLWPNASDWTQPSNMFLILSLSLLGCIPIAMTTISVFSNPFLSYYQ